MEKYDNYQIFQYSHQDLWNDRTPVAIGPSFNDAVDATLYVIRNISPMSVDNFFVEYWNDEDMLGGSVSVSWMELDKFVYEVFDSVDDMVKKFQDSIESKEE